MTVEDLETIIAAAGAGGARTVSGPVSVRRPGIRSAYLAGSEGDFIELLEPTRWQKAARRQTPPTAWRDDRNADPGNWGKPIMNNTTPASVAIVTGGSGLA